MHRKLIAVAAAAGAVLVPAAASAAGSSPAEAKLEIKGAYLYVDHLAASKQDFVRVVFRTRSALPRRFDGLIRAGAAIEGVGHSLSTAKRTTNCYSAAAEIKGGSIATIGSDNQVRRKGAKLGRTFTVTVETKGGQSVTRKLVLRAERKGDDAGRPLGC